MTHLRALDLDAVDDPEILAMWEAGIRKQGFVVVALLPLDAKFGRKQGH